MRPLVCVLALTSLAAAADPRAARVALALAGGGAAETEAGRRGSVAAALASSAPLPPGPRCAFDALADGDPVTTSAVLPALTVTVTETDLGPEYRKQLAALGVRSFRATATVQPTGLTTARVVGVALAATLSPGVEVRPAAFLKNDRQGRVAAELETTARTAATPEVSWHTDYAAAYAEAAAGGRPLLAVIGSESCVRCKKLDGTALNDPKFLAAAGGAVCVKIDGNREARLVEALGVTSYPTVVVAASDGKILATLSGYQTAEALAAALAKARDTKR